MIKYLLLIGLFIGTRTEAGLYNIKDLEVLESTKSYLEFIEHAKDIKPSLRGKHWSQMVGNMAVGLITESQKKKVYDRQRYNLIEGLVSWPSLNSDGHYLHKRREYGLNYLNRCMDPLCENDLKKFWHNSPVKDGEMAKNLALNLKRINAKADLSPFLKVIGHDDYALFHCKKPWIQAEIFAALTEPLRMDKPEKLSKTMNSLVGDNCWKSLRPVVIKGLLTGPGLKQDYAFNLLKTKEKLSQEWIDFYYTSYFLGNPIPGPTLNEAWNTLKEVGQNYNRRMQVLQKLRKLDPLPGKLFSIIDPNKKETFLKYFKKNFPEYLSFYSKTCLNYLSGQVNFDNGNPTPDCDNLFQSNQIEDRLSSKYSALKKKY